MHVHICLQYIYFGEQTVIPDPVLGHQPQDMLHKSVAHCPSAFADLPPAFQDCDALLVKDNVQIRTAQ